MRGKWRFPLSTRNVIERQGKLSQVRLAYFFKAFMSEDVNMWFDSNCKSRKLKKIKQQN